jgi:hypothetical protein
VISTTGASGRFRPELLHYGTSQGKVDVRDVDALNTPRTWEFTSDYVKALPDPAIEHALYAGTVGDGAAIEFTGFLRIFRELPSIDAILLNPAKAPVPTAPAALYAIASALAHKSTENSFGRVCEYLGRIPAEYGVLCVRDAVTKTPALGTTPAFIDWSVKNHEVML